MQILSTNSIGLVQFVEHRANSTMCSLHVRVSQGLESQCRMATLPLMIQILNDPVHAILL